MTTQLDAELPLPEPYDYCYEWDGPYGKRKFTAAPHNGRTCDRAVPIYTADQVREAIAADRAVRQPVPPVLGLVLGLADVDAAFEAEIHRVSHLEYASFDICRWFFSNVRNRLAALIQPQDDLARSSSEAPAAQAQQRSLDVVDAARWRFFDDNAQSELKDRNGTRRRFAEWMQFAAVMEHGSRSAAIDHLMDRAAMTPEAPQPPQGGSEGGA